MRERRVQLGLLDFSWVNAGQSPAQALGDTFAMAKRAEALGFSRYWVGEHHVERHACGSPQILAAILGVTTKRIRIGVGSMLLHYWAALKLAEDFRLLETIFGRIDLGVGRGRADNLASHRALAEGRVSGEGDQMLSEEEYGRKLDELVAYFRGSLPPDHPHHDAAVIPALDVTPEIWVCGSATGAPQAARIGARFCCTLFHGRIAPPVHLAKYRGAFQPSRELAAPYAAIAVAGVCAETEAEALAMRAAFPNANYLPSVVGSPEQCKARIDGLREEYGVDEVIVLDIAPDGPRRAKSAELLAQVCGLSS
jgi:luciferase family oxidoreductase group 1